MTSSPCRTCLAVGALLIAGCSDQVCCEPPPLGSLRVTTITTGPGLDPDGYTLVTRPQIPGRDSVALPIGTNATITSDLELGRQTVRLADVQSNCTPSANNPGLVTIVAGDTVAATLTVACS